MCLRQARPRLVGLGVSGEDAPFLPRLGWELGRIQGQALSRVGGLDVLTRLGLVVSSDRPCPPQVNTCSRKQQRQWRFSLLEPLGGPRFPSPLLEGLASGPDWAAPGLQESALHPCAISSL